MLWIGRPIGTLPPSCLLTHAQLVTSTAASVGPYRLCSSLPSLSKYSPSHSLDNASPLLNTRLSDWHLSTPGSRRNGSNIEGTKCTVVIPSAIIFSTR